MVRIRINEDTRAKSFRLANGVVLKRGDIIDVPSEAIPDDEIARKVIEHICDDPSSIGRKRTLRIYCPRPGIGDVHWVFLKLRALLARHYAQHADVLLATEANRPAKRSQEFMEANPLVRFVQYAPSGARSLPAPGYIIGGPNDPWDYALDATQLFDEGRDLATEFLPGLKPEWHYLHGYEVFKRPIYENERKDVVCFSMLDGNHVAWGKYWNQANWAHLANLVGEFSHPMAVGLKCDWRWADSVQRVGGRINNAAGKTDRFFGLIALLRRSRGVIGTCSGLTMIAAAAGIPTIIIWPEKFGPQCWRNWIHPDAENYYPVSYEASPEDVLEVAREAFDLGLAEPEGASNPQSPEVPSEPGATEEQLQRLGKLMEERGKSEAQVLAKLGIENLGELTPAGFKQAKAWLTKCKKVKK